MSNRNRIRIRSKRANKRHSRKVLRRVMKNYDGESVPMRVTAKGYGNSRYVRRMEKSK